jgi:hypothetical protein
MTRHSAATSFSTPARAAAELSASSIRFVTRRRIQARARPAVRLARRVCRQFSGEYDVPRYLEACEARLANVMIERSVATASRAGTTAAATSSPSDGCGMRRRRLRSTPGCSLMIRSTSVGAIFSPPRLMSP